MIIIDEAHLLFDNSSNELQRQIISIIKLIRSKWVGIFFCTQLPDDIPAEVLSQLGCKIQHALRAFTERDRKAIKAAVENYPISTVYKLDSLITELGIGEAMVTCLDTNWVPTPVAHTIMRPPMSLMGIADASTLMRLKTSGYLVSKYAQPIDRESAREILQKNIEQVAPEQQSSISWFLGWFEWLMKNKLVQGIVKNLANTAVRTVLGKAGIKTGRQTYF